MRLSAAAVAALLTAGVGLAGTHVASAVTAGCQVTYTVTNQWPGGFGVNVSVNNLGDPINGWKLTWAFPAGQTITQLWNGTYTQSGSQVTVSNVSYNAAIPSGGSAGFGFNGAYSGSNPVPSSFALNGVTCTGGVSTPTPTVTPPPSSNQPCDLYASGGTPCVAAHSTTRALYASYNGSLYQVRRSSDNTTQNIGVLSAGGYANAAAQDSFCAGTTCLITIIYDQSGRGNHLTQAPPGGFPGPAPGGYDNLANATAAPTTINGHKAYGVFVAPGTGYRNNNTNGIARGDQPEGM
ncbi:arabinofuranosidase catalytic domain-containing protein, partial [Nonomuraea angiospora]|nr:arabinofuranosidase catalytic domain-containing protein [Nonomuraea angiospora]